mgnify:CR=1 FL=1|jgi:hypothetical protein
MTDQRTNSQKREAALEEAVISSVASARTLVAAAHAVAAALEEAFTALIAAEEAIQSVPDIITDTIEAAEIAVKNVGIELEIVEWRRRRAKKAQ